MSPYIKQDQRFQLNDHIDKLVYSMDHMGDDARKGVFNYVITKIALGVIGKELKYGKINDVVGAMECCKMEYYARKTRPYEEKKAIENGEV